MCCVRGKGEERNATLNVLIPGETNSARSEKKTFRGNFTETKTDRRFNGLVLIY